VKILVLDAAPLIAWIEEKEPTSSELQTLFDDAARGEVAILMTTINAGEVFYHIGRRFSKDEAYRFRVAVLPALPLTLSMPSAEDAWHAAEIKTGLSLSYADAMAAAMAIRIGGEVVTCDPDFANIPDLRIRWVTRPS
jgi:predicted nucleic acid-binding protein